MNTSQEERVQEAEELAHKLAESASTTEQTVTQELPTSMTAPAPVQLVHGVFVTNISAEATEANLRDFFQFSGNILQIIMSRYAFMWNSRCEYKDTNEVRILGFQT